MIEGIRMGGIAGASPTARDTSRAAGGFTVETGPTTRADFMASVQGIALDSLLTLQAVDEAEERDKSAKKRGLAMIAALTDLQRAMLAEEDPALTLRALSELAADGPLAADPGLAAVLRAVVLRSRLEVARRTRDPARA